MEKKQNNFEPFPIRSMRASDKVWELFKKRKAKSQKTTDRFLLELLEKNAK